MTHVSGLMADGFEPVREVFVRNFAQHGEVGAGCCVYVDGRPVVDLWGGEVAPGGPPYTASTLQMVASATKGALTICALQLVEAGQLDLDAPVAEYWPEFAAAGKDDIPVRWLLSHRAGLPAVRPRLTPADLYSWTTMTETLAAEAPYWEPGTAHGYHALTFGWLVGELIARVAGVSPGTYFAEHVAAPLGLDFHIGIPDRELDRVAPLLPPPLPPPGAPPDRMTAVLTDPASLGFEAFFVPHGLLGITNDPDLWRCEAPAANGMATAAALARMYAACIGEIDGVRLLRPDTLAAASAVESAGDDLVTQYVTRYGLGFQLSFPLRPFAGDGSVGHYGLGGSVGFAHPELGVAFGYTVNQMLPGGVVDPRSKPLIDAVVGCL
ncbi:MAG: serine hydrolase domain-containing protein [Acidimicrobiales bacterium]